MSTKRQIKRMLVVSNMWPDGSHPSSGIFVKKFVDQVESLDWICELAVMGTPDSKVGKIIKYFTFYLQSFVKSLLGSYDVVYIHYPSFSAPAVLFARKIKKFRIFVNVHGSDVLPVSEIQKKMHKYTEGAIAFAEKVIVPSEYFAEIVYEKYNLDCKLVKVYPSGGVDPEVFHPLSQEYINIIKENLGLKPKIPTVCFAGRITEGKGWDTYIEAVAKILAEGIQLNALLIGSGDQDPECLDLLRRHNLVKGVIKLGLQSQEKLCEFYNAADLFIFPGRRSESLGLVAVEAMACGTPVISSDFAAPKYYIENGINGYRVPINDAESLSKTIEKVISDPEQISLMRKGALNTAEQYYPCSIRKKLEELLSV